MLLKRKGKDGFAFTTVEAEVASRNDIHTNNGIIVVKIVLDNLSIGDGIACRQQHVQQLGVTLGSSAYAVHSSFPKDLNTQALGQTA